MYQTTGAVELAYVSLGTSSKYSLIPPKTLVTKWPTACGLEGSDTPPRAARRARGLKGWRRGKEGRKGEEEEREGGEEGRGEGREGETGGKLRYSIQTCSIVTSYKYVCTKDSVPVSPPSPLEVDPPSPPGVVHLLTLAPRPPLRTVLVPRAGLLHFPPSEVVRSPEMFLAWNSSQPLGHLQSSYLAG